eukprot:8368122-Alexandrium_andersonii.AAC.1
MSPGSPFPPRWILAGAALPVAGRPCRRRSRWAGPRSSGNWRRRAWTCICHGVRPPPSQASQTGQTIPQPACLGPGQACRPMSGNVPPRSVQRSPVPCWPRPGRVPGLLAPLPGPPPT